MVSVSQLCRTRTIRPYGVETPILVPSFSSRGFRDVGQVFADTRDEVSECSLVSAYDLHYGRLAGDLYASDLLFVDSGGYECKASLEDDLEAYQSFLQGHPWSPDRHAESLRTLKPLADIILVSYDDNDYIPLSQQISRAERLANDHSGYAIDFLLKPETLGDMIDVAGIAPHLSIIAGFSILGVVEQELGTSLLDRCTAILNLRKLLLQDGSQMPIHVFGSLDPLRSVLYFLCGADVFDGLAWLRYSYRNGLGRYMAQAALVDQRLRDGPYRIHTTYCRENLKFLKDLQAEMRHLALTHDMRVMKQIWQWIGLLNDVLQEIGIQI